jgi:hypothetical protein
MLLVVGVVAILACTMVTSLGVLVVTTERGAVRGALESAPTEQKDLRTWISRPTVTVDASRTAVNAAVQEVVGPDVSTTATSIAITEIDRVPRKKVLFGLAYFGELDGAPNETELLDGRWPEAATTDSIEVAIPSSAASARKLSVGSTIPVAVTPGKPAVKATVVGIYDVGDPSDRFWSVDYLNGEGFDADYPVPGTMGTLTTDITGPLLVAAGELDARQFTVDRVVVTTSPNFSAATIEGLLPLVDRVSAANVSVPATMGSIAGSISVLTELPNAVRGVTAAISATRATVLVVSVLILVLAIAALTQTARLLNGMRANERSLMRARGASGRQIIGLAAVEAAIISAIAAAVSPLLARFVYLAIAQQPAMRFAGMDVDPGLPMLGWVVSVSVAIVLWLVILAPLLRNDATFHEAQQVGARQRRSSVLQRSGVDVAVLVLAAVAYWQLTSFTPALDQPVSLSVDPIVVAAPALIVLAGALLSVRLVPLVSRVAEAVIARGRGAVVALAAWEVGRRPQKATAAIMLLTLAIAIGSFSLSYLESWRQSQTDQAEFAVGAPVRVQDSGKSTLAELTQFSNQSEIPQPVVRTKGEVAGEEAMRAFGDPPRGKGVVVLGVTADARQMLDRDRLATEGGTAVLDAFPEFTDTSGGTLLPENATGISIVFAGKAADKRKDLVANVRAVFADTAGTYSFIPLGSASLDGPKTRLSAVIPSDFDARTFVGITAGISVDPFVKLKAKPLLATRVVLTVREFSTLTLKKGKDGLDRHKEVDFSEYARKRLTVDTEKWHGWGDQTAMRTGYSPTVIQTVDWPLELRFTALADLNTTPMMISAVAWQPVSTTPIVVVGPLAGTSKLDTGDKVTLIVDGQLMAAIVAGVVDHAPGAGSATTFSALGTVSGSSEESTIIVDSTTLMRTFVQAGVSTRIVTEWWVDVPAADQPSYLDAVAKSRLTGAGGAVLGTELQQHPLRVAILAALWLVTLGAAVLAAVGFGIHATGNVRSRAMEFAQIRAIGLTRSRVVAAVTIESLLLAIMGTGFGIALGVALSYLITPIVGASRSATETVPAAIVVVPWVSIGLLAAVVGVLLLLLVLVLARTQRSADPASALRWGGER